MRAAWPRAFAAPCYRSWPREQLRLLWPAVALRGEKCGAAVGTGDGLTIWQPIWVDRGHTGDRERQKVGNGRYGLIAELCLNVLFQMLAKDPYDDLPTGRNTIRADVNSVTVGFDFAVPPEIHFFAIEYAQPLSSSLFVALCGTVLVRNIDME